MTHAKPGPKKKAGGLNLGTKVRTGQIFKNLGTNKEHPKDHQKVRRSLNEIYGAQIPFVPNTNRVGQVKSGARPTKIFLGLFSHLNWTRINQLCPRSDTRY